MSKKKDATQTSVRYTRRCSCYYDDICGEIIFYNEDKDCEIKRLVEKSKEIAEKIMADWVAKAPAHVRCECLDDIK